MATASSSSSRTTQRFRVSMPVELDGRTLEGGGQLLRNAVCLSAMTGIPISIHHIRGGRSGGGGLKAGHLACVLWLAHACNARLTGAERGSQTLIFEPGKAKKNTVAFAVPPVFKKVMIDNRTPVYECRIDIGTAGSTGLALQAILPYILFSELPSKIPVRLTLTGGTNVSGSPSFEYVQQVLLPTLHSVGFPEIEAKLKRRGWCQGPQSMGEIVIAIPPRSAIRLAPFSLRPVDTSAKASRLKHLKATFVAPASCHVHFRDVLGPAIQHHFGKEFQTINRNVEIVCEGSLHERRMYLILVATMPMTTTARKDSHASSSSAQPPSEETYKLASSWLYERKIRSQERVATEMVEYVTNNLASEVESGAYVDCHMRDQLVIFQALACGKSEVYPGVDEAGVRKEPSLHARTAEWVAKEMLGVKFDAFDGCEGVGFGVADVKEVRSSSEQQSSTRSGIPGDTGETTVEAAMERLVVS